MQDLKALIRNIPDFPKPGIVFRDLTTLLKSRHGLAEAVKLMTGPFATEQIDLVVGIEARGFIFGVPMALEFGAGFIPVRKPGKLPAEKVEAKYELEYGEGTIEIHRDAVEAGQRVLLVDDLLATGGTMAAALDLVEELQGVVVGISFLVELEALQGRRKLNGCRIESAISY